MDAWVWIVIAVAAIVVIVAMAFWFAQRRRHRSRLRERFGPEYDRGLESATSRRKGEGELAGRAKRRDEQDIQPLTQQARERYTQQWGDLQARFVDVPQAALVEADALITLVMRDRGYPIDDFESQSELVSVDHPDVVQNYRTGHDIYTKTTSGDASTEDLRQAVVAYRALFEELVTDESRTDENARS